jgi:isopentenyl diphosphate isomerase/L-lactate dehydrogenase-like FMN-dependent dehydrogenase
MSANERIRPDRPPAPDLGSYLTVDEFEEAARGVLPRMVFDYFAGGAGEEWTLAENRRAFERWVLRPRVLVDVADVDLRTTVLGQEVAFPILLAPTALQRMAHRYGELASARAAASLGTVMAVSTVSTAPLEEVASSGARLWFQLYVMKDRDLTAELVKRAHAAGYGALVLTVDAPILGRRFRDDRNRFSLPPGIGMANLEGMGLPESEGSRLFAFFVERHDASLTWDDVAWLDSLTPLPLVLKGIVRDDDAWRAVEAGAAAIVVSNHGGRQLDGAPATIDVLSEVIEAVEGRAEVLVDGGIRRGSDAMKALALGARAVLVGRPYLWGLAVDGEAGVRRVMELLRDDLALAMALCGCPSVSDIDRSLVARAPGASG